MTEPRPHDELLACIAAGELEVTNERVQALVASDPEFARALEDQLEAARRLDRVGQVVRGDVLAQDAQPGDRDLVAASLKQHLGQAGPKRSLAPRFALVAAALLAVLWLVFRGDDVDPRQDGLLGGHEWVLSRGEVEDLCTIRLDPAALAEAGHLVIRVTTKDGEVIAQEPRWTEEEWTLEAGACVRAQVAGHIAIEVEIWSASGSLLDVIAAESWTERP